MEIYWHALNINNDWIVGLNRPETNILVIDTKTDSLGVRWQADVSEVLFRVKTQIL